MESNVKDILSTIKDAVERLSKSVAVKQEPLFKQVLSGLKRLDTKGDNIINNMNNLKLISQLKTKIEQLIIDDNYKQELKSFASAYDDIQNLHNEYFSKFAGAYRPLRSLNLLKKAAVDTTINNLTEAGVQQGVTEGMRRIINTSITTGGSYAALTEELRNFMLTNDTGEGALERYVKTYANTAINQYSAEYSKSIADDLGLEWYGYSGSLLETSRPFCQRCVEKEYIHVSEFPTILEGKFGVLGNIPVSKKTGLPSGLMVGTDNANLVRRRGGWNCGHQMIAITDLNIPEAVKQNVYSSSAYKLWAKNNGKEIKLPVKETVAAPGKKKVPK